MISRQALIGSMQKSANTVWRLLPVLLAVLLLASLIVPLIPVLIHHGILGQGVWIDTLGAAAVGSLASGQPIVGYLLAGEMQKAGVGLIAVTAFIAAWVTVGVVSLPAEAMVLGTRFALVRNAVSFVLSLLLAWLIVVTVHG